MVRTTRYRAHEETSLVVEVADGTKIQLVGISKADMAARSMSQCLGR
jgi:hypothetical protein